MPNLLNNWMAIPILIGALALAVLALVLRRRLASRRELERHARELAALADVGRSIAQSRLEVDALCDLIYRKSSQIVDTTTFQIGLFEDHQYAIRIWLREGERLPPTRFELKPGAGLVEWVRASKQPVLVRDFERELDTLPARPQYLSAQPPRSAVFVPLIAGDAAVGAIAIQSRQPGAFDQEHVRLLSIIANQAAPVIANVRLLEAERRRVTQLQLIGEVSRQVAAILDLDVLFDKVVELIHAHFNYYFVAVVLWEEETGELVLAGTTDPAIRGRRVKFGQGISGWVVQAGEPLLSNDVSNDPRYLPVTSLPETRSELAVPLIFGQTILGALDVESSAPDAFTEEDIFILRTLADQVAIAIHEARLYAAEREQAWISTALLQVADATAQASSLDEVLETVARITPMLAGVDRCGILLWDPIQGVYRAASSFGLGERAASFAALRLKAEAWPELKQLAQSGGVMQIESPEGWLCEAFGRGPTLALPLYARGEPAGVMLVGSPEGSELSKRRAALIMGIANQAALAIESAQLLAAQREEAWVNMALLQVAEAVGSQTDLHDILTTVVRLTPLLVGVEACLIFLLDRARGLFVSGDAYGLPRDRLPVFRTLSIPRAAWPITEGQADVPRHVIDALQLRAPLAWNLVAKGEVVGVMLIDGGTETLAASTRRANILAGIASQTAMAIVNAQLTEESIARQRLEQELQVARKIQESFLPERNPALPGWQIAAFWRSARQVGGDFYDFIWLQEGSERLGIAIADVADKGVPAALFMALCRTLLRAVAISGRNAADALMRMNDLILSDARSDLFVTIFYVVLDTRSSQIGFANAGHNPPLLLRAAQPIPDAEYLTRHGIALGVMPGIRLDEDTRQIEPGDVLVLYTDGVIEALNEANEEFGLERLERCALDHLHESAAGIVREVKRTLQAHVGDEPPFDDITLVVVKRLGA
ncbi:MAG TPA: SpoIIE family protein phosphatase [Anaerolineae bacterium]|nr:SpoIIE family protein phosphatase [Anaerolineae bacterium]